MTSLSLPELNTASAPWAGCYHQLHGGRKAVVHQLYSPRGLQKGITRVCSALLNAPLKCSSCNTEELLRSKKGSLTSRRGWRGNTGQQHPQGDWPLCYIFAPVLAETAVI